MSSYSPASFSQRWPSKTRNTRHLPHACWCMKRSSNFGSECTGADICSESVRDDQIEHIQRYPDGSPVMTKEEDRSSTMAVGGTGSDILLFLLSNPRLAMLTGGKSPLFLFSLNLSMCSRDRLVGRILQLQVAGSQRHVTFKCESLHSLEYFGFYSLRKCDGRCPHGCLPVLRKP